MCVSETVSYLTETQGWKEPRMIMMIIARILTLQLHHLVTNILVPIVVISQGLLVITFTSSLYICLTKLSLSLPNIPLLILYLFVKLVKNYMYCMRFF